MQKRTLHGIKPFNECWFRSCYYHQLIAALGYFGVPAEYVIFNADLEIVSCDSWGHLVYREKSVLSDEELGALSGVEFCKYHTDDILSAIIESINKNHPVIVGQDHYYVPYRKAYYQKIHGAHFLLIYGYDSEERTFTACEHELINSYDFRERKVAMETVAEAHRGFCKQYPNFTWSVLEFKKSTENVAFYKRKQCMDKMSNVIAQRNLHRYVEPYELLKTVQENELANALAVCRTFGNWFQVFMTQYAAYFNLPEITERVERLWHGSSFFLGITAKAYVSNKPDLFKKESVEKKLDEMHAEAEQLNGIVRQICGI